MLAFSGCKVFDKHTYLSMNLLGQFIIVPLSLAALLTGLVQSLGTPWGLFRHYWVLVKFTLTIGATIILLLHQFTAVAGAARRVSSAAAETLPDVGRLGVQLVADAGVAVLVLLVITTLSVFKPWGKTRYGRRADNETAVKGLPSGLKLLLAAIGVIVLGFLVLHLLGGGLAHHGRCSWSRARALAAHGSQGPEATPPTPAMVSMRRAKDREPAQ
jgi:hypothetical protein